MFRKLKISTALAAGLMVSGMATADYRDALELPSLKKDSVNYSLMLDIASVGTNLVAVGERGHILNSADQGQSWQQAEVPTRMQLNATYFINDQIGWAVGEDEVILKTTDAGASWLMQHNGLEAGQTGPLLDVLFVNDKTGFAIGVFNKIYRTDDAGESWQEWIEHVDNLDEWHLIGLAATGENGETVYISSESGLLFRSTDGGETFVALQTDHDGSFHGILARKGADGLDRLVLLGVGGILYTTLDSGETWNLLETGTEDGLSSGVWLKDGSALVVGANGTVLRLTSDLQTIERSATDNGLPLSAALQLSDEEALLVGFGGFHRYKLSN